MANFTQPFATRLCLSGVESRRLLDTFKDFGVRHIQVSYYYLQRVFSDPLEFQEYAKGFDTVIIDSGTVYGNTKNEDQKDELLKNYAQFVGALDRRTYTAVVYEKGLGLDKIVPDEALIYPLDDIRSTFDNDLRAIMGNLKYVGVSYKEASAAGGENLIPIFAQAAQRGTFIHAFGTGSRKILSKYPFYSANSSSWRSGSRYLNTYIYEGPGRGLRLYQPTDKKDPVKTAKEVKTIRRRQSNLVKVRNPDVYKRINWEEAYEGDSWEVDKGNLAQWILFQTDLELMPQNKYFLTDTQRQEILLRKHEIYAPSLAPDFSSDSDNSDSISVDDVVDAEVVEESTEVVPYEETQLPSLDVKRPTERLLPVDDRMRTLRQCDYCILAGRCPKYQPGAPCSYGLSPENPTYDHNELDRHILEDAADLLAIQKDRVLQSYLEEKADASGMSKDTNREIKTYMELVLLLREATDNRDTLEIKAKGGTGMLDAMFKKNG